MGETSPLFNQFANSAPIMGADHPSKMPEQGLYRLHEAMQGHFAEIVKIVLHRAYGVDTLSAKPQAGVNPLHPYRGDLFLSVHTDETAFHNQARFEKDLNNLKNDYAVTASLDAEQGLILRFRAADMYAALQQLTNSHGIQHDDCIARHTNALHHLLERSGGKSGYKPAHKLH